MRDRLKSGCPLTASASEAGRQGRAFSACFTRAFEEMVTMIENSIDAQVPASKRRSLAMSAVAAQIGAIAVSRALQKADAELADEVLKSTRETMGKSYKAELARLK